MAELQRLESRTGDPKQGGFVMRFPSGRVEVIEWNFGAPMRADQLLQASKDLAAKVIERLSSSAAHDDMERTNWASVVAAIQRIVTDWNDTLKASIYAAGPQHHAPTLQ